MQIALRIFYISIAYLCINLLFTMIMYKFYNGEVENAVTFLDYFYFSLNLSSTSSVANMYAITQRAKFISSVFILFTFIIMTQLFIYFFASNSNFSGDGNS